MIVPAETVFNGVQVSIQISDPWDLGERLEWKELVGELTLVDLDRNSVLVKLDIPVSGEKEIFPYLVASTRHVGSKITDLSAEKNVFCNFTGLTYERSLSADPLDTSWWRGGGLTIIGGLRQMSHRV